MADQHAVAVDDWLGPLKWLVLGLAVLGIVGNWVLYNWAPPIGSASPLGMVVGLVSGGYLAFLVYEYVT